ncbi:MAG: GrpB family protein [Anaerovoracaceae bacterium]
MENKLYEMSLEELWKLFPIYLTEHKLYWKEWYSDEENFLKNRISKIDRINHIGSTAISSICAKPIIDILVEISKDYRLSDYKEAIVKCGYICMSETSDRISFNKGYTEKGFAEKVFHLHLRYVGDNDELYFRDYLTEYINIAVEYERMKLNLWKKYEFNRDGYTNAKTDFIQKYTEKAKLKYGDRY